jgi:hypothetical protein
MLAAVAAFAPAIHAKDKVKPPVPKDEIQVIGHVPVSDGPIIRFLPTQHYSSYYLYAEHASGKNATLIDITAAAHPAVLAEVAYPSEGGANSLSVVAGTAALLESGTVTQQPSASLPSPQIIRIMDFSDPKSPKVAREFTGVTAMLRDSPRGLIFVANSEGVWILQQHLADDPERLKEYDKYVLYDH